MSNKEPKYGNLPKLQRRIVLCLAHFGPMNIREANKKLSGEYTSTNRAMHELEKKGIIQKVKTQKYRGREFRKFWLTDSGLLLAVIYKANPEILKEHVKNIYGMNEHYSVFFETINVFPSEQLSELYTLFKTTAKGLRVKAIPINIMEKTRQDFLKAILKSPTYRKILKETFQTLRKALKQGDFEKAI
ncbi:MAG: hypothetical protein ACPLYF_05360, partial [Fervidobacterium sp.]